MRAYHFALRNDAGDNEDLGYLALPDDDAALAGGGKVIRDIMSGHTPSYSGSIMEIIEGQRVLGAIPLELEGDQRQKKFG